MKEGLHPEFTETTITCACTELLKLYIVVNYEVELTLYFFAV